MASAFKIFEAPSRSILSPVTGFLREAGFTHSLSPARNCTYGCTYCYVPTMRIYGGLRKEDWEHWGQLTTFKNNAVQLLARELKTSMTVYCSPLTDPYQPAEREALIMPGILRAINERPPRAFVIQTRGTLILRDLPLLHDLSQRTRLRISFSVTTNREEVRRCFEPHCESNTERLHAVDTLREAGLEVYTTLAPILPCDPEQFATDCLLASRRTLIGDPFHIRATKKDGATTRDAAFRIAQVHGWQDWLQPTHQNEVVNRIRAFARAQGHDFQIGPPGFGQLAL